MKLYKFAFEQRSPVFKDCFLRLRSAVVAIQEKYRDCCPRNRRSIIGQQNLSPFSAEIWYLAIRIKIPQLSSQSCCFFTFAIATLVFLFAPTRCDSSDAFVRGYYVYRESTTFDYARSCVLSNCYLVATHEAKFRPYP